MDEKQKCASEINEKYFHEVMPLGWYTLIGETFKNYDFSCDMMLELFEVCNKRGALDFKYVRKVAEDWHKNNIKSKEDIKKHLEKKRYKSDFDIKIEKIIKNLLSINLDVEVIANALEIPKERVIFIKENN